MSADRLEGFKVDLSNAISAIENQISVLVQSDPIFGLISSKRIRCGKENCKCSKGERFFHGPYYYLRLEPDYKYNKYIGKRIPGSMEERIEVGNKIKELEKRKKKIQKALSNLEKIS